MCGVRRNMSTFVWEEERLGHFSERPEVFSDLPLGNTKPRCWSMNQGLCLATDGDTLIGRADNGAALTSQLWSIQAMLGQHRLMITDMSYPSKIGRLPANTLHIYYVYIFGGSLLPLPCTLLRSQLLFHRAAV